MPRQKKPPISVYTMAKPNPLFTEEQRYLIRFVNYSKPVPCALAHCQRKGTRHWTMLCDFVALEIEGRFSFNIFRDGTQFPALTPVCRNHVLCPIEAICEVMQ